MIFLLLELPCHTTGNPMPHYMEKVHPSFNFYKTYKIKDIHCISVPIIFKGNKKLKQCYRWKGFGDTCEVWNVVPKWVQFAENDLSKESTSNGVEQPINMPILDLWMILQPTGFIKDSSQVENRTNHSSSKNTNQTFKENQMFIYIFKEFNFTEK